MSADAVPERTAVGLSDLGDPQATIIGFLRAALERGAFDAVVVPMMVPAGDGFAHLLVEDPSLLEDAWPMPPVISVQGGKAASALTRLGQGSLRVCAVVRPCEARAAIELAKLAQVDLGKLSLLSMDCFGALPSRGFPKDPKGGIAKFGEVQKGRGGGVRPICQICPSTSMACGDLHVALLGAKDGIVPLFAFGEKGREAVRRMGLSPLADVSVWERESRRLDNERAAAREQWRREFGPKVQGAENLLSALSACIDCHNCMRVCPVCYCRQCYFDSERLRHPAGDYLGQARRKGSLRLPPDTLLFHLGRMTHMSLTCVSCGACEDACPASIPIAQLFSYVAERAQRAFDYVPGRSLREAQPLVVYREEELEEDDDV